MLYLLASGSEGGDTSMSKRLAHQVKMTDAGFEPAPMKTTALTSRLRPLGQPVVVPMESGAQAVAHVSQRYFFRIGYPAPTHTNNNEQKIQRVALGDACIFKNDEM